jgi:hypothetical protein
MRDGTSLLTFVFGNNTWTWWTHTIPNHIRGHYGLQYCVHAVKKYIMSIEHCIRPYILCKSKQWDPIHIFGWEVVQAYMLTCMMDLLVRYKFFLTLVHDQSLFKQFHCTQHFFIDVSFSIYYCLLFFSLMLTLSCREKKIY